MSKWAWWNKLVVDYPKDTVQFVTDEVLEVQKIIIARPVLQK